MKALSLTQPWATLVAIGAKQFETRSWSTNYRGPLYIHASKGFPAECRRLCYVEPFYSTLGEAGYPPGTLPLGALVGTAVLTGCITTGRAVALWSEYPDGHDYPSGSLPAKHPEIDFGDYTLGRFAWGLRDADQLPETIPYKGRLGLFEVQL